MITPSINADRTVTLRIAQQQSRKNEGGATIPVLDAEGRVQQVAVDTVQRQTASGTIVGKDGLAVALGGLIEEEVSDVRGSEAASWQTLLDDRAQRPGPYQQYAQRRAAFLADVRQGVPRQALATELVPPAGDQLPKLLAIDAWQLTGTALMLDDRPSEVAAAFSTGHRVGRA
jgi:hypothetical protein